MKTVLGIITARGGSKSIPGKNIKELAGKPLLGYTAEAALASKLDRTILSTDYEDIAAVGKEFGVEVPFMRPDELSQDDSTSIDAVKHALNWLKENEGKEYDYLMILQPTSPLRTAADINACIELAIEKDADSVMSKMQLEDFSLKKLKTVDSNGLIGPLVEDEGTASSRRQDAQAVFKRNAAIYLTKVEHIMNNDLFGKFSYAYVMPPERSVDINAPIDFDLAELYLNRQKL